ncbi:MAG: hypothetical protein RLZZ532_3437 [Cyanobacteriota bacterium]|jgi:hypothetical protein
MQEKATLKFYLGNSMGLASEDARTATSPWFPGFIREYELGGSASVSCVAEPLTLHF